MHAHFGTPSFNIRGCSANIYWPSYDWRGLIVLVCRYNFGLSESDVEKFLSVYSVATCTLQVLFISTCGWCFCTSVVPPKRIQVLDSYSYLWLVLSVSSGNRSSGSRCYHDLVDTWADCLHLTARTQTSFKGCLYNGGSLWVVPINAQ